MRRRKHLTTIGLILALVLSVVSYPALEVKADPSMGIKNGSKKTLINSAADRKEGYYIYFSDMPDSVKKIKVSNSKKSIATIKYFGYGMFTVKPKKAGTTKVTLTGTADGKKITRRCTIKIVNFKQPFKSLKIDGKDYRKKVKSSGNGIGVKTKKSKIKFNYKLNSGWKVVDAQTDGKKVKNGKTYSLPIGEQYVGIELYVKNKKTGEIVAVWGTIEKK